MIGTSLNHMYRFVYDLFNVETADVTDSKLL